MRQLLKFKYAQRADSFEANGELLAAVRESVKAVSSLGTIGCCVAAATFNGFLRRSGCCSGSSSNSSTAASFAFQRIWIEYLAIRAFLGKQWTNIET